MYGLEVTSKGGTTIIDSNYSNYVITQEGTATTGLCYLLAPGANTSGNTDIYLGDRGLLFVELNSTYAYTMISSFMEGFQVAGPSYVQIAANSLNSNQWAAPVVRTVNYFVAQPYDTLGEPTPTGYGLAIYKANGVCGFVSNYKHCPIIAGRLVTTAELSHSVVSAEHNTPLLTPIVNMPSEYKLYACLNGTAAWDVAAVPGYYAGDSYNDTCMLTVAKQITGATGFTNSLRISSKRFLVRYRGVRNPAISYYPTKGTRSILVAAKI